MALYKYVCAGDQALDKDNALFDWTKFLETADLAHVPFKAGEQAVVYEMERPTVDTFDRSFAQSTETRRAYELVAFHLRSYVTETGERRVLRTKRVPNVGERALDEDLRVIWKPSRFAELASRIISLAELDPLGG